MNSDSNAANFNSGGIGFGGILGIVFIVLKLTGVITWPWIWVLAPIWIPWVIVILIVAIVFLVVAFSK